MTAARLYMSGARTVLGATLVGMDIEQFGSDDAEAVARYVELANAARAVDSPWVHPLTQRQAEGTFRLGWDGEPPTPFLATVHGTTVAAGEVHTSEYDNLHVAWLSVEVHPERRRRGYGTQLLEGLAEHARKIGRTSLGIDGWESDATRAFAEAHGFEKKSQAINRRQFPGDLDWAMVEKVHSVALDHASSYEIIRRLGRTPDDELVAVAEMSAAINDAPTDDLDIEDEVFPPERIRAYEDAQIARGHVLHRVFARHRETGELAGHTIVAVDEERPQLGHQHDTSVVKAHRGHRLGLLLKADMNLWLRETQPQLESVDTWNAESNDHMIGVNEQLGYRIMGRALEFQKSI